jgi:hypothetical protein
MSRRISAPRTSANALERDAVGRRLADRVIFRMVRALAFAARPVFLEPPLRLTALRAAVLVVFLRAAFFFAMCPRGGDAN